MPLSCSVNFHQLPFLLSSHFQPHVDPVSFTSNAAMENFSCSTNLNSLTFLPLLILLEFLLVTFISCFSSMYFLLIDLFILRYMYLMIIFYGMFSWHFKCILYCCLHLMQNNYIPENNADEFFYFSDTNKKNKIFYFI